MESNQILSAIKAFRKKKNILGGEVLVYIDDEHYDSDHEFTDVLDYLYMQIDNINHKLDDIRKNALGKETKRLYSGWLSDRPDALLAELDMLNKMVDSVKESDAELYLFTTTYTVHASKELALFEIRPIKTETSVETGYGLVPVMNKNKQISLKLQHAAKREVVCETYSYKNAVVGKDSGEFWTVYEKDWVFDNENYAGNHCDTFGKDPIDTLAPVQIKYDLECMIAAIDSDKVAELGLYQDRLVMAFESEHIDKFQKEIDDITKKYRPVRCKECGKFFILPEYKANWYTEKGLNLPRRCGPCRKKRAEKKESSES